MVAKRADPGGEKVGAAIGTEDWAKRWRLEFQSIKHNIPKEPERFAKYFALGQKHRVWTLLSRADGSKFASFEEFCSTEEPWGLSSTFEEVRKWLEMVGTRQSLQLEIVAPAKVQAGPGRGKKTAKNKPKKTIAHHERSFSPATDGRLRAINRAPEPIRDLYRRDLVSQVWAAKLGPRNPSPETAALIATVTESVRLLKERKVVDATVKSLLGVGPKSRTDRALALVKVLTPSERAALIKRLKRR